MEIPSSAVPWVVGVIATSLTSGVAGALVYFIKKALSGLESSVERLSEKLDSLIATQHAQDMASALLQHDVAAQKAEVHLNRDRFHTLAQEVTVLRSYVETLREQVRELRGDTNPRGRVT